jgi:hypothetical protein
MSNSSLSRPYRKKPRLVSRVFAFALTSQARLANNRRRRRASKFSEAGGFKIDPPQWSVI